MTKRMIRSSIILTLGLAAMQIAASAQDTQLEGIWCSTTSSVDPQTSFPVTNAVPFRGLHRFVHDGTLINEAAFLVSNPARGSGVGSWAHTQGRPFSSAFRFFRYNPDGSFLAMREVTFTIMLDGDQ